ncbi:hypothetical protein [Streptomyces hoynatensis]|uniref:Uncharacterized protein n=1 Tax=Streptomyces hoynatensis TaxID=1141874 RepID=A0A3A9Z6U0_9ACTN|nr:hypothetical protein [Streptomyces hoynatensis]RKN43026.1 hypothetical protein D7294_10965 [Streptomyces hoynatensis]
MNAPLVEPLTASPFRSVLHLRFGANPRPDRALVLIAADGRALVGVPAGGWGGFDYPRPGLLRVLGSVFPQSGWVSLSERPDWVDVAAPRDGTLPQPVIRHSVSWQVCDPVTVVRNRVTAEQVPHWIAAHLARNGMGTGGPHVMNEAGIAFRVLEQPAAEQDETPPLPFSWDSGTLNAFRFFRELISEDPRGLAALWLLYHPQNAEDVLRWTVDHRKLLLPPDPAEPGPDSWERSLATALRDLTPADRAYVGVNMARLLNDLGVPEAEEALHRLGDG